MDQEPIQEPQQPIQGGLDDFSSKIDALLQDEEYKSLEDAEKRATIEKLRDGYISSRTINADDLPGINAIAKSGLDLSKSARLRINEEELQKYGLPKPDLDKPTVGEALTELESWRKTIKDAPFDPLVKSDYIYDLERMADEEERRLKGGNLPRAVDLYNRAVNGYVGGLLRGVGLPDAADYVEQNIFWTDPENDPEFISKLARGAGDGVASIATVMAATAVGGPYAGYAAGLTTNAVRKYQDGYNKSMSLIDDPELAHQAGLAATPGAALETVGEALIAGKVNKALLPDAFKDAFMSAGTREARADVVRQALADTTSRKKIIKAVGASSGQEAVSEMSGSWLSGYGSATISGRDEFRPTGQELLEEGAIAGIVGAGFGAVEGAASNNPYVTGELSIERNVNGAITKETKPKSEVIKSMLDAGDYAGVEQLMLDQFQAKQQQQQPSEPEVVAPLLKPTEEKVQEDGSVGRVFTNLEGKEIRFDDSIADIHDDLINALTLSDDVDAINELPAGRKAGQRNSPPSNNTRVAKSETIASLDEQLNVKLPGRARLWSELDNIKQEIGNQFPDEQLDLVKRTLDATALAAIQHGVDHNAVYDGVSFNVNKTNEQIALEFKKGKPRSVQDTYRAEQDFEAEKRKYGMLQADIAQELQQLTDSVDADTLNQARMANAREHFAPEAFGNFQNKNLGWKEVLVDMPIDEYLNLAAPIKPNEFKVSEIRGTEGDAVRTSEDNATALKELIEQGSRIPDLPALYLDDTQGADVKVTGHEGRHRAMALKALGYDTMPVVLNTRKIRWSEQGDNGRDFYRLTDEQWPQKLVSEKGDVSIRFPVDRQGNYNSTLSQTVQQSWRQIKAVEKQPALQWPATPNQSADKVAQVLGALPAVITAKNGDLVTIRHNRQGTEQTLFTHLATNSNGSPNVARAAYAARIVSTVENASMVATDSKTGNKIYVARYQDKGTAKSKPRDSVHMVVTKANGDLVTHFINDFAEGPQNRQGEFEAIMLQAERRAMPSEDESISIKLTPAEVEYLSNFNQIDFEEMTDVVGAAPVFSIEGNYLTMLKSNASALSDYLSSIAREPSRDRGRIPPSLHNDSFLKRIEKSALMSSSEGRGNHDQSTNISEQSMDWSGTSVWVDPSTGLDESQAKSLFNLLFAGEQTNSGKVKGKVQFLDEQGNVASLQVPLQQLNNKLRAVITLMRDGADITTVHHELMHYFHRSGLLASMMTPAELQAFEQAANVGKDGIWKTENYERVARAYEAWLRNPLQPGKKNINVPTILERAFRKISSAFLNIYKSLATSPLPSKKSKSGASIPDIHPDFRRAFEKLYSFDPSLRLRQNNVSQNGLQLASVNAQLTGGGQGVSSPSQQPKPTEAQLEKEVYEPDKEDQRNIKLMQGYKPRTRLDQKAKLLMQEINELATGLHEDDAASNLFYAILHNFAHSRRLSRKAEDTPELRNPAGLYKGQDVSAIRDAGAPAYTSTILPLLEDIKQTAWTNWFAAYKARNAESMADATIDEFGSKQEVIQYNAAKKLEQAAVSDEDGAEQEISPKRQAINDNIVLGQAALASRTPEQLPQAGIAYGPLVRAMNRYVEFLKSVDGSSPELSDLEAFRIQFALDTLLNDNIFVGLEDFARHEAKAKIGQVNGKGKYRLPYAKFGLVGILNALTGKNIGDQVSSLRLFSVNLESIAGNAEAKQLLNDVFAAEYYEAVTEAQTLKNEFKQHLSSTREKWFGKLGSSNERMNLAGIISKIMQAPLDLTQEEVVKVLANNVEQLRAGFQNEVERGHDKGYSGQLKIKLLNELLAGLEPEFTPEQFIQHAQEKFPAETGFVLDMVAWIDDNLSDGSRMVLEGLYNQPWSPQGYYLPTAQTRLENPTQQDFEFDESFFESGYGTDKYKAPNPVTVKRSGNLMERSGFLGDAKLNTYVTNLEHVLENAVDGIINDIYTGFARRKLGYMLNPSKGHLYLEVEQLLSQGNNNGSIARAHLRKAVSDMVSTDLAQHRYVNQLEMAVSQFRRNIAPAMLSSLHQFVTQPASQFVAHIARTPSMIQHYGDAFNLVFNPTASFQTMLDRHLSTRAPSVDHLLAKGQSIRPLNPLDKLGAAAVNALFHDEGTMFNKLRNGARLINESTRDLLLAGLRTGDMFSAKVIFAAELIAKGKQQQGISDARHVDYTAIKAEDVVGSINIMDEAINASRNARRGTALAHPSVLINLLTVFAGHRISVASATGLRLRNVIELAMDGNFKDGMMGDSARYVAATLAQSATFTILKYGILSVLVRGIYEAMTPEEDDERHWLYGDVEREQVAALRKLKDEKLQKSFGPNTLTTSIIRDAFGNFVLIGAFAGIDNTIFSYLDPHAKAIFETGQKEAADQIRKRIQTDLDVLSDAEIKDLQKQIKAIESTKFVPMAFKNFGSDDLSGGFGAAAQPIFDAATALNEGLTSETKSMGLEDFALLLRAFGLGQPEITKALKLWNEGKAATAEELSELPEREL